MNKYKYLILLIISTTLFSCKNEQTDTTSSESITNSVVKKEITTVKAEKAHQGTFNLEIISNGKVYATKNADIKFPINEIIQSISIKNGQVVSKGQVLAVLDNTELKGKLARSKEAIDKARVDLDDRLIDYGYRLKDSAKVPVDIMRMAMIKSGYNRARYDYVDAKTALNKTLILAPFTGKIANLAARVFNSSDAFKTLCTLIEDSKMKVEFNVLETEYHFISKGSSIEVSPFGEGFLLKGVITEVNPLIDENGMIKITATVNNSQDKLLDGMSVKVIIKKAVANKLYIPKEAVLQRQNRQVVFTYEDGQAKWNYVETGLENSKFICINSGLTPDMMVIVSNNIHLAHESEVKLDETE